MQISAPRVVPVLATVLLALATPSAFAADDTPLQELLIEKGFITQDELDEARAEVVETPAETTAVVEVEEEDEEEPKVDVSVGTKGLVVTSPNGDFVFAFGGRLQVDAGGFTNGTPIATPLGDGTELRRARIKSYGTLWSDWDYKLEVNFDPDGRVFPTDAWLRYSGRKPFTIVMGHQKVPYSQQSMTSSNWQVFQERALIDSLIDTGEEGRRRMGAVVGVYGDHWNVYAGVFGEGLTDPGNVDEDWAAAGRGVIAPLAEDRRLVTFSGAVYYRQFKSMPTLRYRSRPESHLAGTRLVDTGVLMTAVDTLNYNASASLGWGSAHAQGEYSRSRVNRWAGSTVNFDGWYVQAGYFITGESRNWDMKSGKFKRIKPKRKCGAWEIAARYSTIDMQDRDVLGGREADVTAGLNWWVNQNVMFRLNYVRASVTPTTIQVTSPFPQFNQSVNAFMGRAQVVF